MKRIILFIITITVIVIGYSQNTHFYYYKNTRQYLNINTRYAYISGDIVNIQTFVEIYPTLAKDEINIISNNNVPLDICFVNLSGKILKKIRLHSNEKIDISSLSSGVYNVIINKTYSKKIIKL